MNPVLLLSLWGCTSPSSRPSYGLETVTSAAHLSDVLFSDTELPEFFLTLEESSLQALRDEPYTYVMGSLRYGEEYFPNIGVRTKGANSWQPIDEKPSLKIQLDWAVPGQRIRGLEELTFNAMNDDHSLAHERIGYRLYRDMGVPAARATHASVWINGEFYGLYTHVETVDDHLIGRWFDEDEGGLFELQDADFTTEYLDGFELEHAEDETDPTLLDNIEGIIEALSLESADDAMAAVEEHLNLDQYLLYWAVTATIGQFDGYPYSFPGDDCHLYDDPDDGRLHFLPHGVDEAFYQPSKNIWTSSQGLLSTRCLESSTCTERFEQRLDEVLVEVESGELWDYASMVLEQIAPLIDMDARHDHDERDIAYYQQALLDFIQERSQTIDAQRAEPR